MEIILKYFPLLTDHQKDLFTSLYPLYLSWNKRINLISRKDIGNLYEHHVLHSMAIARMISFASGSFILDAGTGGGFPGIPLAILFPGSQFHLVDSVGKKVRAVEDISKTLGIHNIRTFHCRVEELDNRYDFVVSRAVTSLPVLVGWVSDRLRSTQSNPLPNGIICLTGGDLTREVAEFGERIRIIQVGDFFDEPYFATKKIIYLPGNFIRS